MAGELHLGQVVKEEVDLSERRSQTLVNHPANNELVTPDPLSTSWR